MRLEEWQKFIETQFLADETELPAEQALATTQQDIAAPGVTELDAPEPDPSCTRQTHGMITTTGSTQGEIDFPEMPAGNADAELYEGLPAFLTDIEPRRANIAPATNPVPPAEFRVEVIHPPARTVSKEERRRLRQQSLQIFPIFRHEPDPEAVSSLATETVSSSDTEGQPTDLADGTHGGCKPQPFDSDDIRTRSLQRRVAKMRAPQARNVRPENVPSGVSAADLWPKIPRHLQTLLALDRLEEEVETAQYSYKRPFQESRRELIGRLLDPILSLEEAARLLNVCPATVRRYTNRGILTHYRKDTERTGPVETLATDKETRQRRFRLSDILAFLETQQAALDADRAAERTDAKSTAVVKGRTDERLAHDADAADAVTAEHDIEA